MWVLRPLGHLIDRQAVLAEEGQAVELSDRLAPVRGVPDVREFHQPKTDNDGVGPEGALLGHDPGP